MYISASKRIYLVTYENFSDRSTHGLNRSVRTGTRYAFKAAVRPDNRRVVTVHCFSNSIVHTGTFFFSRPGEAYTATREIFIRALIARGSLVIAKLDIIPSLFSRYRSRKVQHPIWSREKYTHSNTFGSIIKHQEIRSMAIWLPSFDATRLERPWVGF